MTYTIRCYKNNSRIAPLDLNGLDARLFYKSLKTFIVNYKKKYAKRLSTTSLLIQLDNKEIFHTKSRLEDAGICTIQDIIEYLDIEEPKYIISDDKLITEKTTHLPIYVLEMYSDKIYLTDEQIKDSE